jgi:hypothetical protein
MVEGDKPGSPPLLLVRFTGIEFMIEGRHLDSLCYAIGRHGDS